MKNIYAKKVKDGWYVTFTSTMTLKSKKSVGILAKKLGLKVNKSPNYGTLCIYAE